MNAINFDYLLYCYEKNYNVHPFTAIGINTVTSTIYSP